MALLIHFHRWNSLSYSKFALLTSRKLVVFATAGLRYIRVLCCCWLNLNWIILYSPILVYFICRYFSLLTYSILDVFATVDGDLSLPWLTHSKLAVFATLSAPNISYKHTRPPSNHSSPSPEVLTKVSFATTPLEDAATDAS